MAEKSHLFALQLGGILLTYFPCTRATITQPPPTRLPPKHST